MALEPPCDNNYSAPVRTTVQYPAGVDPITRKYGNIGLYIAAKHRVKHCTVVLQYNKHACQPGIIHSIVLQSRSADALLSAPML